MNPKTYNQIIEILESFATASPFINNFGSGFKTDLNETIKNNSGFTVLYAEPLDIKLNDNTTDYRFRIYSLDVKDKNKSNTRDVLSDTAQILTDLRKYLIYNFESSSVWSIQFNSNLLIPLNNFTNDYTNGFYMDIIISSALIQGDCDIPAIPVLCDPVNFYLNDVLVGTVGAGGELNISVIDTGDIPVGSLIDGNWVVPSSGVSLPINIINSQGCLLDTISVNPLGSFTLTDGVINDSVTNYTIPIVNTINFNIEIDSITQIDDCTIEIDFVPYFPIALDNGLGLTIDTIVSGAQGGSTFNLPQFEIYDGSIGSYVLVDTFNYPTIININGDVTAYSQPGNGNIITLDVQSPKSGIIYKSLNTPTFIHSGSFITGDSVDRYFTGQYERVYPEYPTHVAEIDYAATQILVRGVPATGTNLTDSVAPTILKNNNAFGNRYRFTDSVGNPSSAAVGSNIWAHVDFRGHSFGSGATPNYVIDHLTGWGYYIQNINQGAKYTLSTNAPGQTWQNWMSYVASLGTFQGLTGWMPLDVGAATDPPGIYAQGATNGAYGNTWVSRFFKVTNPEVATTDRISFITGESASSTECFILYDSSLVGGSNVTIQRTVKAGTANFQERLSIMYIRRIHY